jgi:hypothetical protein
MQSYILEMLPAIHGTIIGIGAAFFSAFAMFAYQKLQETKDELDKIILEVETFSTPSNYIGSGNIKIINDDGELDWDGKAKELIFYTKGIYSYLDYEEKYGIPRDNYHQVPSENEIINSCRDLCQMFHYLFTSYPFSGKSMVHVGEITNKINEKKSLPFDKKRLQEIERRIGFLSWCWEGSNKSLIKLGQECTNIERKQNQERAEKNFNEMLKKIPEVSKEEKERLWVRFIQPSSNQQIDYSQIIYDYFNKVLIYQEKVLPKLKEMINVHDTFNERFKVKSLTIDALLIFLFIFLLGVITPLVLLNAQKDYNITWCSQLPYILLFMTSFPYIFIWFKLLMKIKNLNYK